MVDNKKAQDIANSLVQVYNFHDRVWHVYINHGIQRYQLVYDREEVAEHIASHLRGVIVSAIELYIFPPGKGDWRVGLYVQPKSNRPGWRRAKIIAVFPPGHMDIDDPNGVFLIECVDTMRRDCVAADFCITV